MSADDAAPARADRTAEPARSDRAAESARADGPGSAEGSPRRHIARRFFSRTVTVMGIPAPLVALALVFAVVVGLLLSQALRASTLERTGLGAGAVGEADAPGKNASGQTVVTEATLGTEVQRLIDAGTLAPMASFDAAACLKGQNIDDPVLMMEEVAWGSSGKSGWLLVHGPVDRDTLRATGGTIGATVVTSTCGADPSQKAADSRLWAGTVMIGGL